MQDAARARTGLAAGDATERSFHVWSRTVGGDDHPLEKKRIKDAVLYLPNRWPEVRKVEVAVAVEETKKAPPGLYVIFLPTETETTVGAHINAANNPPPIPLLIVGGLAPQRRSCSRSFPVGTMLSAHAVTRPTNRRDVATALRLRDRI